MKYFYSKLPIIHVPDWLRPLLRSIQAHTAIDSDFLYWRMRDDRSHLNVEVDKILMYSEGNPLQYREYYEEEQE